MLSPVKFVETRFNELGKLIALFVPQCNVCKFFNNVQIEKDNKTLVLLAKSKYFYDNNLVILSFVRIPSFFSATQP